VNTLQRIIDQQSETRAEGIGPFLSWVEVDAILAEMGRLRADAARYRWLRHGDNDEKCVRFNDGRDAMTDPFAWLLRNEELDAAIDAAMGK